MRRFFVFAILLLTPLVAFADPAITSVTPSFGVVTGGTTVTIRISGFNMTCAPCPPIADALRVYFGGVRARSVTLVNETTITAVTPEHYPGTTSVVVELVGYPGPNSAIAHEAFTFTGHVTEAFDRVLFPLLMRPVNGAFGSQFVTAARIGNNGTDNSFTIYGDETTCTFIDPPHTSIDPVQLPTFSDYELHPLCYPQGTIARFFLVPKGRTKELAGNIRVYETSRQGENHGVEIPVVREEEFAQRVTLLGVPVDSRFRLTLRIYALESFQGKEVKVSINGNEMFVPLPPSGDPFVPAIAALTLTEFPPNPGTVTVKVESHQANQVDPVVPIWAFIAVTNNQTQHITTVTP